MAPATHSCEHTPSLAATLVAPCEQSDEPDEPNSSRRRAQARFRRAEDHSALSRQERAPDSEGVEPLTTTTPTVLTAGAVVAIPKTPLGHLEGVSHAVLWHDGTSMAGVMTIAAGHRLGAHAHRENHHHMWVLEGAATILDAHLGPGSYVHIPAGVEHDIDATDTDGCTLLYLYLRTA